MEYKTYQQLRNKLYEANKNAVQVGGIYYHWKDPNTYFKVIGLGFTEWDTTPMVIYAQVDNLDVHWVRRLRGEDGWLEPANKNQTRFVLVK